MQSWLKFKNKVQSKTPRTDYKGESKKLRQHTYEYQELSPDLLSNTWRKHINSKLFLKKEEKNEEEKEVTHLSSHLKEGSS